MPIDASIPLRVERHQAPNPLAMLMQIQEMQQRQRYGQDQEEDRKVRREELDFRRQQMAAAGQAQQREAAQAQQQAHIKAVARATVALKGMAPEQRAAAFPQIAQRLKQQGILPADAPEDYAAMGGDPWVEEQFASLMSDEQLAAAFGPQKPAAKQGLMNLGGGFVYDPETRQIVREPPPESSAAEGFTLSPGGTRYDAQGKVLATAPAAAGGAAGGFTLAPGSVRYDAEGKIVASRPVAKTSTGTGGDASALAAMAAKNPAVLQGLTPTVSGAVLEELAKRPELRQQYEQTRMAPVRAAAQTALDSLEGLIEDDPKTKEARLTPGAQNIYGVGVGRLGRYIPNSNAADASAALNQVTGQLVVNLIASMKAQSRTGATGFGQLSVRELDLLESTATMLRSNVSEPIALRELKKLRDMFQKIIQPSVEEVGSGGRSDASSTPPTAADLIRKYGG